MLSAFAENVTFPANFANAAYGRVGNPPETTFVLRILKNGKDVGTITISTAGVVSFSTSGVALSFAPGDLLVIQAPSDTDAAIEDFAASIKGTRS
ncbi:hypothetical protein [Novosphingobium clariflavum]|uniref:Uncharacterized protein n=1 Tax=Novosphingobium clariflavum TaxID=2029884 RepID=A0ABV6SCS5_9SPHN|nr:hypothetical protein [Novosphingobium clariflavum]